MLSAADYFIEKENLFILSEDQKIRLVSLEALIEDVCRMHIFSFDKIPLSRVITCVWLIGSKKKCFFKFVLREALARMSIFLLKGSLKWNAWICFPSRLVKFQIDRRIFSNVETIYRCGTDKKRWSQISFSWHSKTWWKFEALFLIDYYEESERLFIPLAF